MNFLSSATDHAWRGGRGMWDWSTGWMYRGGPNFSHTTCSHCAEKIKAVAPSVARKALACGAGRGFVRLAGLSGCLAVGMGAYGAHVYNKKLIPEELKNIYETANRYHFIHTLALAAVPFSRRPNVTGSLITLGMLIFCGTCYCHAVTGNKSFRELTPYGGILLMVGWLSMVV